MMTKQKQLLLFGASRVSMSSDAIPSATLNKPVQPSTSIAEKVGDPRLAPKTPAVLEGPDAMIPSDDAKTPDKPGPAKARKGHR